MRPRGCPSASAAGERLARRGDSECHEKGRSGQQCAPRRRVTLLGVDGLHRILLQVHGAPTLAETVRRKYLVGFCAVRRPKTRRAYRFDRMSVICAKQTAGVDVKRPSRAARADVAVGGTLDTRRSGMTEPSESRCMPCAAVRFTEPCPILARAATVPQRRSRRGKRRRRSPRT
jgi:hypothetical protein